MRKSLFALGLFLLAGGAQSGGMAAGTPPAWEAAADSELLEKGLQGLDWEQFKAVLQAIPKLKADVDAYGPLGWQYVEANYRTYRWKKSIGKLDEGQRRQLAALIREVKDGRPGAGGRTAAEE